MSDKGGQADTSKQSFAAFRTGIGYDSHRFAEGGSMLLGGVEVASGIHLSGHSDGDAVAHALTDALLGAAGFAGDIGSLFPDTDAANKGRDSIGMLGAAVGHVTRAGYAVMNADITVVTEQPKVAKHRDAIRQSLAAVLGVEKDSIGFKGKTNEGMGWIGRGEGLACIAVVMIARKAGAA
jgi:2-C-methyl-D-erythritol 2,4-cyclodiphosphate synthase